MKVAALAVLTAAVLAGCGGGNDKQPASTTPPAAPSAPHTVSTPAPRPTATTNTPPTQHRTTPQPLGDSSKRPLRVTSTYMCADKHLKALSAAGPVEVKPKVVRPGQSFAVTITDPSVKVALVSLAGVASKPIQAPAKKQGGRLTATLRMPGYASCGNKLLEIEGDISAEAYVAVSR